MNCKPGELALCVRGDVKWVGLIITTSVISKELDDWAEDPCWETAPPIIDTDDGMQVVFRDVDLIPIRPGALQDEEVTSKELEAA